ncbi:hypothetical protein K474DRAFT_1684239 [Panus rudis PR-1116 ss-1]|nr:hypothetical protein K474DRAFT_1684239 [Panus rudis PR-1116 ss-1]
MSTPATSTTHPAAVSSDHISSLDQLWPEIIGSTSPSVLNQRLKTLSQREQSAGFLANLLADGQDPLTLLLPERHTVAYLYILCARLNSSSPGATPALHLIEGFCSRFKPEHARLAPDRVTALAKGIVRASESGRNLKYALKSLRDLVTRYPPHLSVLTTLHKELACITTHEFALALPVLSVPITDVDTNISDLTYNDNLVYHYAGGIILAALKMWREAEEFFEICVTAPGSVAAAIQLEALKKMTLVQLILYGKAVPPPKYASNILTRLIKSTPYAAFAKAYPDKVSNLEKVVEHDREIFLKEQNWGLIQQAIGRAPRWLIQKLTSTYVTLGLSDISHEIGSDSEESVRETIVSMIDSGDITATISVDGTVTFSDPLTNVTKADVDRVLREAQEQSRILLQVERKLSSSREYITKASSEAERRDLGDRR